MRVLQGSTVTVTSPPFVGVDGETPTDAASVPTVAVVNLAGTTLTAPTAVNIDDAGRYTTVLTAATHLVQLDVLTVTWTATVSSQPRVLTQQVEVVDNHYATLPELRAILNDQSTVPAEALISARDAFADLVEKYRGASWVGRACSESLDACGYSLIVRNQPLRSVRSITHNGASVSTTGAGIVPWGAINLTAELAAPSTTYPSPNVTVTYLYGFTAVPPTLNRACREYVRATLLADTGGIPRNAISYSTGDYSYRMGTADWDAGRPTGIMAVDDLLNSVDDHRIVQVA